MKTHHVLYHGAIRTFLAVFIVVISFSACKKSQSELGKHAFKISNNKAFKEVSDEGFAEAMKMQIREKAKTFKNPKFLTSFYEKREYAPVLLNKVLADQQIDSIVAILDDVVAHGLQPKMFKAQDIKEAYAKLRDKNSVKRVDEAYEQLSKLELLLANALTDYSNAMQFGVVSPRRIYAQYYTETIRPDEASFGNALEAKELKQYLTDVQPKDKAYLRLQQALKDKSQEKGINAEEMERILMVNLERLRWKNKPKEDKYVWVNIPDFTLDVMEKGRSALHMKVCVGEGRNKDYKDKLVEYDESGLKKDRKFNRETPQLNSIIHSVQVNPVWNIPESIATNEITKHAAADPYYLANNNIDVYLDGKVVEDPETIDWSAADAGKKYRFKQRPGDDNSLGKIKFLFNNQSSVYLHDTPAKEAFNFQVRAVSHGCVRVANHLALAQALFGNGATFDGIKSAMQSGEPRAKDIALPKKVPVYLAYQTCWLDATNRLQYRKDVYGLDIVLYTHLMRV